MTTDWQPIKTAPQDGSWIKVRKMHGEELRVAWLNLPSIFRTGPQWWSDDLKLADVPINPIVEWSVR